MHDFEYKGIRASEFYFNDFLSKDELVGEVTVIASVGLPKEIEERKHVRCDISVVVKNIITNEENIKLKTISKFNILSSKIDDETLFDDAIDYCIPIALEKSDEIISKASELLVGKIISVQLAKAFLEE